MLKLRGAAFEVTLQVQNQSSEFQKPSLKSCNLFTAKMSFNFIILFGKAFIIISSKSPYILQQVNSTDLLYRNSELCYQTCKLTYHKACPKLSTTFTTPAEKKMGTIWKFVYNRSGIGEHKKRLTFLNSY